MNNKNEEVEKVADTDLFLTKLGINEYDFNDEPLDQKADDDAMNSEEEAEHLR